MKKTVLSIQHLLAMFGATVLVPILTGFNPSVAIFCAGIGTLIFHFCTEGKVPVFLGSSFAFIPLILSVKEAFNGDLAYAQGGIIVAGLIYIMLSFVIKMVGVDKIKKYFPPQVTGAMIAVIGLNLLPTAFDMALNHTMVWERIYKTIRYINCSYYRVHIKFSIASGRYNYYSTS